jgi:hypothetical protein
MGAVAVLNAACFESGTTPPEPPHAPQFSATPGTLPPDPDEYLAKIADRIPGFGGMYLSAGVLVVRMKEAAVDVTSLTQSMLQDEDVARFAGVRGRLVDGRVRVESTRYGIAELMQWKRQLSNVGLLSDLRRLDLDEVIGQLRLGFYTEADAARAHEHLLAAGLPQDAFMTEVVTPVQEYADLNDRIRAVPGAVVIENGSDNSRCTLGVNALANPGWPGQEYWGFITNSHCSDRYGDDGDGTAMYQHTEGANNLIGYEYVDFPLYDVGTPLCPSNLWAGANGCRFSDASFFVYTSDDLAQGGTIGRTIGGRYTTINSAHPRFLLDDPSLEFASYGMELHKIGRVSGWTTGEVSGTCVSNVVAGIVKLCQTVVDFSSSSGDSGAPVFAWDGYSDYVELFGILWGGNGSQTWFSPWVYVTFEIEYETGPLEIAY